MVQPCNPALVSFPPAQDCDLAISALGGSQSCGTVILSNSNGVSFGMTGSTITASALGGVALSAAGGAITSGTAVFSNSNGISFGIAGQTVTASAAGVGLSGDYYDNAVGRHTAANNAVGNMGFTNSHRTLYVGALEGQHRYFPYDVTASTFMLDMSISGSTATMSDTFTSHFFVGIYTSTGGTLSLLNSVSGSFGFGAASTDNSSLYAGQRFFTFHSSQWSSSPVFRQGSRYYMAWFWSSSGALNQSGNMLGYFDHATSQRSGTVGAASVASASMGPVPFYGIFSSTTGALPASIANSSLSKVFANAFFVPRVIMAANVAVSSF